MNKMPEINFRKYKQKEYRESLEKLLADKGLHDAVRFFCDKINDDVSSSGYIVHMSVIEHMNDILHLIELSESGEINDKC